MAASNHQVILNSFILATDISDMEANMLIGRLIKATGSRFPYTNQIISVVTNYIMFLVNTLISLAAIGMMTILEWHDMERMMIKPERKYGFGDYPDRE